jgi:hypothetical protein
MESKTLFRREGAVDPCSHREKMRYNNPSLIQSNGVLSVPKRETSKAADANPTVFIHLKIAERYDGKIQYILLLLSPILLILAIIQYNAIFNSVLPFSFAKSSKFSQNFKKIKLGS